MFIDGRGAPPRARLVTAAAVAMAVLVLVRFVEVLPTTGAAEARRAPVPAHPRGSAPAGQGITPRVTGVYYTTDGTATQYSPRQQMSPPHLNVQDVMWASAEAVTKYTPRGMMRSFGLNHLIMDSYSSGGPRFSSSSSNQSSPRRSQDPALESVECNNLLENHPVYVACKNSPSSCMRLDLRGQDLCGTIPTTIAEDLPDTVEIDISGRDCDGPKLTGTIPAGVSDTLSQIRNPSIKRFDASRNNLGGNPPSLDNGVIEEFVVDCNCLAGTIPPGIGGEAGGRNVVRFSAASNSISGGLPPMTNMAGIRSLDLGNNRIAGTIPDSIGMATDLVDLTLSNNALFGSVPSVVGLLTMLKNLDLDVNELVSELPSELGELVTLSRLNMTLNKIVGSLPKFLGNCTSLVHLFLSDNLITGPIVDELSFLPNIVSLVLGNNALSGTIPEWIGNLPFLRNLNLKGNQLEGWLPSGAMSSLNGLTYLDLCCGAVNGAIPSQIGTLTNLKYLLLDNNTLSKTIPSQMGSLTKLQLLYMPYAGLSGTIPTEMARLADLQWLSLAGQNTDPATLQLLESGGLIGRIPTEVGAFTNMRDFDVGISNRLSGWLPTEMGLMTTLEYVWIDYNRISGSIPSELGHLTGLRGLFLEGNVEMCGSVPPGLPPIAQPADPDWIERHYWLDEDDHGDCSKCNDKDNECPETLSPTISIPPDTASPTTIEVECSVMVDMDVRDGDFFHVEYEDDAFYVSSSSDADCSDQCNQVDDCEVWVRRPSTGQCWMGYVPSGDIVFEVESDRNTGLRCDVSRSPTTASPTGSPGTDTYTFVPYVPNTDEIFKGNKPDEWFGKMLLRYLGTNVVIPGSLPEYVFNTVTHTGYYDTTFGLADNMAACQSNPFPDGCAPITASTCSDGSTTQAPSPVCWQQPACYDLEFQDPTLAACACVSAATCDCFLCGPTSICCENVCIAAFDLCLTACGG